MHLVYVDETGNTGKNIWASTNEAKYNDYVLYNTPGSVAAPVVTPPVV